jgi:hypothetical protein
MAVFESNAFMLVAPATLILDETGFVLAKTASVPSELVISAQTRQVESFASHGARQA